MARLLELYKGQREVYCDDNDDCFEVEIKRTRIDKSVKTFHLLPIEQRAEIVKYLCENRKRVNFNPGELLFYSIMSNNQKITAMLRKMGVKFSNERIYGFTKYPGFTMWNIFIGMLMTLDDDVIVDVIRDIIKEIGGKRIYCGYKIHEKNFDPDFSPYGRMRNRFFKPEFFSVFLENFKLNKFDRTALLKEIIAQNRSKNLAMCAEQGWLKEPCKRDEIIAYASEIKNTECLAWLLDYKNRNFDLAAERAKAEKRELLELNAAPYSITALKDIWRWKKQEDGTLVVTVYYGTGDVIKVPPKIGKRAVTAIGERIFSRYNSEVYPGFQGDLLSRITEVVLPDGIRSIGERAFAVCRKIEEQVIPNSVSEIGESVFQRCSALRFVKLPAGLKRIGNCAFEGCKSLEELVVPVGTVEIGEKAFSDCGELKTVVIPASVKVMGNEIFHNSDIVTVIVEPNSYAEEYCKQNKITFKYGKDTYFRS